MRRGDHTPWGPAQSIDRIADGLLFVSTAGHGGFWVGEELRSKMPKSLLMTTSFYETGSPWFEEDCEAVRVMLAFPEHFPKHDPKELLESIGQFHPEVAEAYRKEADSHAKV